MHTPAVYFEGDSFISSRIQEITELHFLTACPITSYTFRKKLTEGYINVTTPAVPELNLGTVCSWIDLKDGRMNGTWFSYATPKQPDSLSVFGGTTDNYPTIDIQINGLGYYPKFYLPGRENIHLCLAFSVPEGFLKWYVNGIYFMRTPINVRQPIKAGGVLIVGQEQDRFNGGFDSAQAYEGDISNFIMWTRPLSGCEIFDIARRCICPRDYFITLHHKNVYLGGAVSGKVLNECPISSCKDN